VADATPSLTTTEVGGADTDAGAVVDPVVDGAAPAAAVVGVGRCRLDDVAGRAVVDEPVATDETDDVTVVPWAATGPTPVPQDHAAVSRTVDRATPVTASRRNRRNRRNRRSHTAARTPAR
jgi:hypothetical protein